MQTIAKGVFRPITKTIILGSVFSILISAMFLNVHIAVAIIAFFISASITGVTVYFIVRVNNDDTPPIYVEGENIYCYNGKVILEFPVRDFYYANGKQKKYFHIWGGFISWGTYNYGKVKIYFDDNGRKKKFVIKNVFEPEKSAFELMGYVENFAKKENFIDCYQILRIRTDATQQEILEAYNKLKNQNADNIEDISLAFEILSSPKKKAEYDVKYWTIHDA